MKRDHNLSSGYWYVVLNNGQQRHDVAVWLTLHLLDSVKVQHLETEWAPWTSYLLEQIEPEGR